MKRERKTTGRPRLWRCRLCPAQGYDLDPAAAFEDHYYDRHHEPAPF